MAQVSITATRVERAGEAEMRDMARRFATLLRSAGDGTARVPGMRWTVGEIGAHVVQSAIHAREVVEGRATSAYEGVGFNATVDEKLLAAQPERDPARLADLVEREYDALAESLVGRPEDEVLGVIVSLTPASLRAILAIDFMLHGTQIAGALGRRFDVPAQQMRDVAVLLLPALIDNDAARGLTATYSLRLRDATPLLYGWENGSFWIDDGRQRQVDCRILADPRAFLLQGIGLYPIWKLALTGKMLSYGRKPWLALRLPKLLPAVPHGGVARN
jgi:uncharacterized protein (TIGR03083 family)